MSPFPSVLREDYSEAPDFWEMPPAEVAPEVRMTALEGQG